MLEKNTKLSPFIHLRVHTAYSLLEGAIGIKNLPDLCHKHRMPAVGITDTNNLFGALEISMILADKGIQPIIGCQLNAITNDSEAPIVLLTQTAEGYENLLRLASDFYLERWNGAPLEQICERSDGLIALAGSSNFSLIKPDQNLKALDDLQKAFDNRLYIELQRHPTPYPHETAIVDLALERNLPMVATNDVYFPESNFFQAHDALLCIAGGTYVDEPNRRRVTPHHYFKSGEEMAQLFSDVEEAVSHTVTIAKRCGFYPKPRAPMLPKYCKDESDELRMRAEKGLAKRLEEEVYPRFLENEHTSQRKQYEDRLNYELGVIHKMGFDGYFLIVSDFVQWAKSQNIPVGPGRGSGAGSIVAWCTSITDMDPLRFNLIFERFLNPQRVSMPDFDIDFCQERRDEVIKYVASKYGKEHVAHIITFGTLQARSILRDAGRVLQMPYGQVDKLAKKIPNIPGKTVSLTQALDSEPMLKVEYEEDESVQHLFDIAMQLEGLYRHASTHAAGVVIGNQPLYKDVPLYVDENSELAVTQFSMKYVEAAGLVKFDFLGLKTLTVIEHCCKMIRESKNKDMFIQHIPLDDDETFALLCRVETAGVFQLEGGGMRDVLRQLKPDRFEDIIALVSLYRPGPMDDIPRYLACKHGLEPVRYLHPDLEPILSPTYGVMVYQEQVMKIAQVLGGYSMGDADLLRRAMGKKIKEEMDAQQSRFIEGAVSNGVDKEIASTIFDQMAKFAGYGFNKSHASPYALLAYQTAYLKAHYPLEFFAANMSADMHNTDKVESFYQDMMKLGHKLLPPCVNASYSEFKVENNAVRYGLGAIKNVGTSLMQTLVEERLAKGTFKDLDDFIKRVSEKVLNKRCLENLIASGALDSLCKNRASLWEGQDKFLSTNKNDNQPTLFKTRTQLPDVAEWTSFKKLQKEWEALGFYLSGHPIDAYKSQEALNIQELIESKKSSFSVVGLISERQDRRTKKGQKFAFIKISDKSGSLDVAVFTNTLDQYDSTIYSGNIVEAHITGKQDESGNISRFILESIGSLSNSSTSENKDLVCQIEKLTNSTLDLELSAQESNNDTKDLHITFHGTPHLKISIHKNWIPNISKAEGVTFKN